MDMNTRSAIRILYRILAFTCLAIQLESASGSDLAAAEEPILKQLILQDFNGIGSEDGSADVTQALSVYPTDQNASIRFELTSDEKRGDQGRSLYLAYEFFPPSDDTQPVPPSSNREIGLRMKLMGLDASGYDRLSFWIKADTRQRYSSAFEVQFFRPGLKVPELPEKASFVVTGVNGQWRRVVIPLNLMPGISDWRNLSEFVIAFQSRRSPYPEGAYFVDDIVLIKTGRPGPSAGDRVESPIKQAWEKSLGGAEAARPHIQARLAGWPTQALIDGKTLPASDREFLVRLAQDTWRGIDALTDKAHGLPLDNVVFGVGAASLNHARIGDYTSVTNIGFHLIAIVSALQLKFITAEEALDKLRATLSTLENLETYQGFFYNYYDTTSLERTSNFISFVDSAWLTAGLIVTRMAFSELYERCTRLIEQGDYGFFYDTVTQQMSHGYYVNLATPASYHYGALFAESRLGSLIAIGKEDVPEVHWFRMDRTFPADFTWQTQTPLERKLKASDRYQWTGGYYEWKGIRYVPSWGGSMFEALMPALLLDEQKYAPDSLGLNGKLHAEIQRRYATEELGYPVWGMSPSSTPGEEKYFEYGVKVLGSLGYYAGPVTPHAAALALLVTPDAAIANLRKLAQNYQIYGDYGFYDAVQPVTGLGAYKYLCLNQAMLFIALANHLGDKGIQRLFASDPIVLRALPVLGHENFFD
jgi:hypothetical protein